MLSHTCSRVSSLALRPPWWQPAVGISRIEEDVGGSFCCAQVSEDDAVLTKTRDASMCCCRRLRATGPAKDEHRA